MPDSRMEFTPPLPETEWTPPAPEEGSKAPPKEEQKSGRKRKLKKLIRYAAAIAVAATLAAKAEPVPLEIVDVESYIEIECAAVSPKAPDYVRFQFMDYRSLYEEVPTYGEEHFQFYLVDPDGTETALKKWKDPEMFRAVYCPEELDVREASYSAVEGTDTYFNLNTGCEVWFAKIGEYVPGSELKIVVSYEEDGVIKRMTSSREIIMLPEASEKTVSVEVYPGEQGLSNVEFVAVLHPMDDSFEYVFGNKAFSMMSFCTRWYDAQGVFLGEGWCFAAPEDVEWPFPDAWLYEGDILFIYQGPVRCTANDSAAAYYSLELMITEESTGWHLVFESELLPIQQAD